jgi:hypothetical protein
MNALLEEQAKRLSTVDSEGLLGQLLWYSMSEVRVPHADAVKIITDEGITHVPNKPRDADVFKRIASKVSRTKVPTNDEDIFENYRWVEFKDDDEITRRLIRETVDNNGRKLSVTERLDVSFRRDTSKITVHPIATDVGGYDISLADEVVSGFDTWKGCLNAYALREWMRAHIYGRCLATKVKPGGGVYFVQQAFVGNVEALERIAVQLQAYTTETHGEVEFHSLPLLDDLKQREMVQKYFEAETVDAVDEMMAEITKISKSSRKISTDKYAEMLTKYQDLQAKTKDYEDLLEQKLASTTTRLDLFERSLKGILGKVKTTT